MKSPGLAFAANRVSLELPTLAGFSATPALSRSPPGTYFFTPLPHLCSVFAVETQPWAPPDNTNYTARLILVDPVLSNGGSKPHEDTSVYLLLSRQHGQDGGADPACPDQVSAEGVSPSPLSLSLQPSPVPALCIPNAPVAPAPAPPLQAVTWTAPSPRAASRTSSSPHPFKRPSDRAMLFLLKTLQRLFVPRRVNPKFLILSSPAGLCAVLFLSPWSTPTAAGPRPPPRGDRGPLCTL